MCCVLVVRQGQSTYSRQIKQVEDDIQSLLKKINELTGMRSINIIFILNHYQILYTHNWSFRDHLFDSSISLVCESSKLISIYLINQTIQLNGTLLIIINPSLDSSAELSSEPLTEHIPLLKTGWSVVSYCDLEPHVVLVWPHCVSGIKESDTGLAPPALWDLAADKQTLQSEQPLQVARYWPLSPDLTRQLQPLTRPLAP